MECLEQAAQVPFKKTNESRGYLEKVQEWLWLPHFLENS